MLFAAYQFNGRKVWNEIIWNGPITWADPNKAKRYKKGRFVKGRYGRYILQ